MPRNCRDQSRGIQGPDHEMALQIMEDTRGARLTLLEDLARLIIINFNSMITQIKHCEASPVMCLYAQLTRYR